MRGASREDGQVHSPLLGRPSGALFSHAERMLVYAINFDRIPDLLINEKFRDDLRLMFRERSVHAIIVYMAMVLACDENGIIKMDDELFREFVNKNLEYLKVLIIRILGDVA